MKLRKATKKIVAVAAATAMASASVFGAAANYPQNFVENGELDATVVYGSSATSSDMNAAKSIVDDLKADYSGDSNNVLITYREASEDGTSVQVIKSSKSLNYGEFIENVSEDIDSEEVSFLGDYTFENGKNNEEYEQELVLRNGEFNYGTRDEDGSEAAVDHIFYDDGKTYVEYTLEFDSSIALSATSSTNEDDFVGETLEIMGQSFIISEIDGNTTQIDSLTLLGGADKVALGEGDEIEVTYEGNTYTVMAQTVDGGSGNNDGEAVISVNGITRTIGEFETKDIAGVTLAVTDIVGSDRDSVKGYVEVIVGGSELRIEDGDQEVEINDEKVSDIYEEYKVTSDFGTGGFSTIELTYMVDTERVLEKGDSLIDPVFNAFELTYNGHNEPEYTMFKFQGGANDDELDVTGELANGDSLNWLSLKYTTKGSDGGDVFVMGDSDEDRYYFQGSLDSLNVEPLDYNATTGILSINVSDDNGEGSGFFVYESEDEQYMYEVDNFDDSNNEADFTDLVENVEDTEVKVNISAVTKSINTALEVKSLGISNPAVDTVTLNLTDGNYDPALEMGNDAVINFSAVERSADEEGFFLITLDSDADGDDDADTNEVINVSFDMAADTDNEDVEISVSSSSFVNTASGLADETADSDDIQYHVTKYGTMIKHDNEDNYYLEVHTPEEQVEADVSLVFGEVGKVEDVIVSADEADAKVAELEAAGATIIGTQDLSADEVEVMVSEPMTDADVEEMMDLIVVGGPAVNSVARDLLGIESYTVDQAGVSEGEYVHRYYEDKNVVLVYGYAAADTTAAVEALNSGNTKFE